MAEIEKYKLVEINRLSPCSMEYYVSIIDVFGHRGLYHFEAKRDAKKFAKHLRDHVIGLYEKASKDEQKKAIELLGKYKYKKLEDYKHLINNSKTDIFLEYV